MRFLSTLLLCVFFFSSLYAQKPDSTRLAPFRTHSLQFAVSGLFNISQFKGATLSYKWQKSQSSAWRMGLSVSGRYEATDVNDAVTGSASSSSGFDETEGRSDVSLDIVHLRYYKPAGDIWLFTALGPKIGFSHNSTKKNNARWSDPESPHSYLTEYTRTGISAGFTAGLGVEWFFRKQMSLHADYGLSLQVSYNYLKRDKVYYNYDPSGERHIIDKDHTYTIGLYNQFSRLGLSIYF